MTPHRRLLPALFAALLALLLVGAPPPAFGAPDPDGTPTPAAGARDRTATVTLVTGDVVEYVERADGTRSAGVLPHAGSVSGFHSYEWGDRFYVVPLEAEPLLHSGRLDRRLFDVRGLVEQGYDDERRDTLPVIVDYAAGSAQLRAAGPPAAPDGAVTRRQLTSLGAVAVDEQKNKARQFWAAVSDTTTASPGRRLALETGITRVWLDGRVEASLDRSVPQIGAPAAWASGYDGSGTDVAVLDTGIDTAHVDVAESLTASKVFTPDGALADRHGHGTHVASIIAGSGAASGNRYRGVAPGADLLVGKVLGDDGFGQDSWIIDGMEWAAAQGAEVVNLSLGGAPTDGTDPMSRAVDALTASSGALFVIAAGNSGPYRAQVSTPAAADAALAVGNVHLDESLEWTSSRGPRLRDHGLKPEITGPGTGIVAARAAGTFLGEAVDDNYTALTGTSMAAPHVAGAAAILAGQHPDWAAAQLKATLTSTASPNDTNTVYEQGAGRVDVAKASRQAVVVDQGALSMGYFTLPYEDNESLRSTRTLTYTNSGPDPVVLDLAASASDPKAGTAPASMVSVEPTSLTIAPGEQAAATVTVDVSEGPSGEYGGAVVATAAGTTLRTALAFTKQGDMVDLTISARDRNGDPAGGTFTMLGYHKQPWEEYGYIQLGVSPGQERTITVPRGLYSVLGTISTPDRSGRFLDEMTYAGTPQIDLQTDRELTFDATEGKPLSVATPRETAMRTVVLGWTRGANDRRFADSVTLLPEVGGVRRVSAVPMPAITDGEFDFYTSWNLRQPEMRINADRTELEPTYLLGSPRMDGRHRLRVVDGGSGSAADLAGVDAKGALVVMKETAATFYADQVAAAADAGAAMAAVYAGVPGLLRGSAFGARIPAVSLSSDDGTALLRAAGTAAGKPGPKPPKGKPADVRAVKQSPYAYSLIFHEAGRVPADLTYQVKDKDLAAVRSTYHGSTPGQEINDTRYPLKPCRCSLTTIFGTLYAPFTRTEYLTTGGAVFQQQVRTAGVSMSDQPQQFSAGDRVERTWLKGPLAPSAPEGHAVDAIQFPARRTADVLHFAVPALTDSTPTHSGNWGESRGRLLRDGEQVATFDFAGYGDVTVPSSPATYRFEVDVDRADDSPWLTSTHARTAWTFRSQRPGSGSTVLPLMDVDYDVPVDGSNAAAAGRTLPVGFSLRHLGGSKPSAIQAVAMDVSFDDGATWQATQPQRRGASYVASVRHPAAGTATGFVSLRVHAQDQDGNAVDQTTLRAYRLVTIPGHGH